MVHGIDLEHFRDRLLALRRELEATAGVREDAAGVVDLDQTRAGRLTRMDAIQDQAMAVATRERAELQIRQITAALERIESGEYGYCTRCEQPIDPRRLEVDPANPLCIRCAE